MGCCSSSSSKVIKHVDEHGHVSKKQRTEETDRGALQNATPPADSKDGGTASVQPSAEEVKTKEVEALPPGMVEMPEEREERPAASDRPAVPSKIPICVLPKLQPVDVSEDEIKAIFTQYLTEVPEDLQKTFDCSWQHLVDDSKKAWDGSGAALQWFWLMHPEASMASQAFGLVVMWLQRTLTASHCIISHLSFKEVYRPWPDLLGGVLESLRLQVFQMPISSIRITLWYTPQDGKMLLDKEAEKPFKQAGYRWFQLANRADSRRGQVMSQKRAQERDGKAPNETPDVCFGSCMLVPGQRKVSVVDEVCREAPGNLLVLAECLRSHGSEELQALAEPQVLQRALQGLKEVKSKASLVRSQRLVHAKEWQDFASECFKDLHVPQELLAWLCRERPESVEGGDADATTAEATPEAREALCGGLALSLNWKAQCSDLLDPDGPYVMVNVSATSSSEVTESPVMYVATEDDEISVMLYKLSSDIPNDNLYDFAARLLKEAPPNAFEDDRRVMHVRLPRCSQCCVASTSVEAADAENSPAFDFTVAREVFGMRLTARGTPLGALRVPNPQKVLTLDTDFLLAVWHEKYADLQGGLSLPLFVTQVRR